MTKKIIEWIINLLNFLIIAILVVVTFVAIFNPELVEKAIKWMEGVVDGLGNWNFLIAFLTAFIESFPVIGIVLPGQQVMLIVGGFFGAENMFFMVLVSIIGAVLGNYLGYFLGVYKGERFFEKYGDWFGVGKTEFRYIKTGIQKHGWWMIVVGKFHNVARAFVPFIAGTMGMHSKKFWLYNWIGSIIRAFAIIALGVFFVENYQIILDYVQYIILGLLVIFGLYIYFFRKEDFKNYLKEKEKEVEEKMNAKK